MRTLEHALTLDFRALEKILKDVCSFDFCLIHVSWCVVGNWARSCWVWSDGIELECVRFRSLHLSLQRAESYKTSLSLPLSLSLQNKSGYWWCMAMQLPMVSGVLQSVKNWEAILLLLHYIRCQVSLVGTTWNTLQFALIASSNIGWPHRIRRETKRERERGGEGEKEYRKGYAKRWQQKNNMSGAIYLCRFVLC